LQVATIVQHGDDNNSWQPPPSAVNNPRRLCLACKNVVMMKQAGDGSLSSELGELQEAMQEVINRIESLKLKLSKAEDDDSEQLYTTHTRLVDGIHCCPDCGTKAGFCGCFVWRRRMC